jgi:hypothetical protein
VSEIGGPGNCVPGVPLRSTLAVAALALATRLVHFLSILHEPLSTWPVVDARWHHLWAGLVAGGHPSAYAPFFRAPLYPWMLGLWYALFGADPRTGAVLSILLSTGAAVVFYRLAYRKLSPAWALAAGLTWALWGTDVFYSGTLLITPLFTLLLLAAFLSLDSGRRGPGWLFLGLACIARPSALLLLPPAFLMLKPRLPHLLAFAAPVLTVWAFNAAAGDAGTVVSSQGGINLYLGNGPEADGYTAFAPVSTGGAADGGDLPYEDNVQLASAAGMPEGWAPSRISASWAGRTLEYAASHPLAAASLLGRKLAYTLSPVEIPSNYDPYYFRRFSPLLSVLLVPAPVALPFLLLLAMLPGALAAGRLTREEGLLLAWSGLVLAAGLLFFTTARFRLPAVPFLLLLLLMRVSRRPGRALRLCPAGLAAGVVLALATGGTVGTGGVNMPFFDGLAHWEAGDDGGAERLFHEALSRASLREDRMDMNRSDAMYDLGVLALRRGDATEAESWWRATLEYNPGFLPAREALEGAGGLD